MKEKATSRERFAALVNPAPKGKLSPKERAMVAAMKDERDARGALARATAARDAQQAKVEEAGAWVVRAVAAVTAAEDALEETS